LNGTIPDLLWLPIPNIGVRNSNPKPQSLLSQERVKLRSSTSNLADMFTLHRVHLNKSSSKILQKRERGHIQGLPKFFGYPLLSQEMVKLQTSNLADTCTWSIRRKSHEKFWSKGSEGVSRDCPIFFDSLYYLRNG